MAAVVSPAGAQRVVTQHVVQLRILAESVERLSDYETADRCRYAAAILEGVDRDPVLEPCITQARLEALLEKLLTTEYDGDAILVKPSIAMRALYEALIAACE